MKTVVRKIKTLARITLLSPRSFVRWLYCLMSGLRVVRFIKNNREERIVLLVGIHEYGNLGDHAICIAERSLLERFFPGCLIVEMPTRNFCPVAERIRAVHCKHMVVAVPGGGFLGTLWPSEERMFRRVLATFRENRVVVLPQTVFFEDDPSGRKEMEKSAALYSSHPDLHIFIRDKSVDVLRSEVIRSASVRAYSVPDIVLSLDRSRKTCERSGILFCLRSDKEKVLGSGDFERLVAAAEDTGETVSFTDTVLKWVVPPEFRAFATERKFDEFRKARLVVTDRLHGMIFACITGTPCVALDNISGKVRGVYELWLADVPYIRFAVSAAESAALVGELLSLGGQTWDSSVFDHHWKKIADALDVFSGEK